jgi:micrococcal nuclease
VADRRPRGIPLPSPLAKGERGGFEAIRTSFRAHCLAPLGATLLLALALGCARGGCTAKAPPPEGEGAGRAPRAALTALPAPAPDRGLAGDGRSSLASAARPAAQTGRVVRIRDGDSIVVLVAGADVEVRLDSVDAPELAQSFGRRAKRFTSEQALGRTVRLEAKGKDKYDRTLAEVFLPDGRSLNRELVSAGCAWWFRRYSTDPDLEARERQARAARRGLWADPEPVPPWDFREAGRR